MLLLDLFLVLAIFMHMVPDVLLFPFIGGRQEEIIKSNISMAHLVPNTPKTTLISLTGEIKKCTKLLILDSIASTLCFCSKYASLKKKYSS